LQERETLPFLRDSKEHAELKPRFLALVSTIESGGAVPRTDAVDRFTRDITLDELVSSIKRDIAANKPVAALDRLHTYCMKKFGHLLDAHQVPWDHDGSVNRLTTNSVSATSREGLGTAFIVTR
jgi:hypothetical protein